MAEEISIGEYAMCWIAGLGLFVTLAFIVAFVSKHFGKKDANRSSNIGIQK